MIFKSYTKVIQAKKKLYKSYTNRIEAKPSKEIDNFQKLYKHFLCITQVCPMGHTIYL